MKRFGLSSNSKSTMTSTSASNAKAEQTARGSSLAEETPSCFVDTHGIITTTMNDLPGYRIVKVLGTIYGITVRSRNWGADIGSFLKSSVGGEIRYFTNLMYTSRNLAVERMLGECMQRGGNAVIAMRFDQNEVSMRESRVLGRAELMRNMAGQYVFAGLCLWYCRCGWEDWG